MTDRKDEIREREEEEVQVRRNMIPTERHEKKTPSPSDCRKDGDKPFFSALKFVADGQLVECASGSPRDFCMLPQTY